MVIYGVPVLATVVTLVAAQVTHLRWMVYLGTAMLCLVLQTIIVSLSLLVLVNQSPMGSKRRPFYARLLLVLILASAVGAITYVQVISLVAAWVHYPHYAHA